MLLAKYIHINMDIIKRPKLYTLPDTLSRQFSTRRRYNLPSAACLVSSADQCSASSVPACVSVCGLLWAVCLVSGTACVVQSIRVRWSVQGYTGGVYSRRPAPPGE